MAGKKTIDGIKLEKIVSFAKELGAQIRTGTNHPYILNYSGLQPCPIANSTNAKRMVVPWLRKIANYDTNTIYQMMRTY